MVEIYNQILFRPLFNLLVFIYNVIPGGDFGVAVILLTVLIRFAFVPLSIKSLVSQKEMNQLQPKIKELQEKYKNDKQALGQATMALYKEHKVNPFSGCLPLLIQLPVLLALYKALGSGLINLAKNSPVMAVIAGVLQWVQSKQAVSFQASAVKGQPEPPAVKASRQMLYFFPVMVIIIAWNLPAGLVLYWIVATIFSIFEQLYINKKYKAKAQLQT